MLQFAQQGGWGGVCALVHAADVAEMEMLGDPRIGCRRFRTDPHCQGRLARIAFFQQRQLFPLHSQGEGSAHIVQKGDGLLGARTVSGAF